MKAWFCRHLGETAHALLNRRLSVLQAASILAFSRSKPDLP